MNAAADGGAFWDTGDDRSRAFAPAAHATVLPLEPRPAPPTRDISRFAAHEETATAAPFLRTVARAAR